MYGYSILYMRLGCFLTKACSDLKCLDFDGYPDLVNPSLTSSGIERGPHHLLWPFLRRSGRWRLFLHLLHWQRKANFFSLWCWYKWHFWLGYYLFQYAYHSIMLSDHSIDWMCIHSLYKHIFSIERQFFNPIQKFFTDRFRSFLRVGINYRNIFRRFLFLLSSFNQ